MFKWRTRVIIDLALILNKRAKAPKGPLLASSKSWRSFKGRGSSWRYHNHLHCEIEAPIAEVMASFVITAKNEIVEFILIHSSALQRWDSRGIQRTVKTDGQSGRDDESKMTSITMMTVLDMRAVRAESISQSHQSCRSKEIFRDREAGVGTLCFSSGVRESTSWASDMVDIASCI